MLSTQLALPLQPFVEESGPCLDDFQRLQRYVLVALGLVVAVQLLQFPVQDTGKILQVGWRLGKLDEPLVTALRIVVHKHRGSGIFADHGSRLLTSIAQSFFCIVDNQFLAKGIDETLGTPRNHELIGIGRREADGIANHVAPQSARCRNQHGIVPAFLHGPERNRRKMGIGRNTVGRVLCPLFQFLDRHELVEHIVVEHQQHRLVRRIVLYAEEPFAGIIGLHVMHVWTGDEMLVLLPIGREGHTAMKEHLNVGPHFFQMGLARQLHHAVQHGEHPRRHAAQVGHVLRHGLTGYAVTLDLKVGEQCRLLRRNAYQVDHRVDVLNEDGAQVTHQRTGQVVVGGMAAAQNQSAPIEHPTLGIVAQVEGHHVGASPVVNALQALGRYGNELRLVVGRSARLGVPLHAARPEHVHLALPHSVDVALQLLVGVDWYVM